MTVRVFGLLIALPTRSVKEIRQFVSLGGAHPPICANLSVE